MTTTMAMRGVRMLGAEEEAMLFARHQQGDAAATRRLVEAHMPLINKVAGRYSHFGPRHGDAVQEGVLGFIEGLRRFDPTRGFRISTFCRWWVRATITDWQRNNHSQVKIGTTSAQKRIFGALKDAKTRLGIHGDGVPSRVDLERLAVDLGVEASEVAQMCVRTSPGGEISLDVTLKGVDGQEGASLVDMLADESSDPAVAEEAADDLRRATALRAAVAGLDERKRDIIERRYLADEAETLEDLSRTHGVTRERIRQLEVQAIEQLGLALPAKLSRMAGQERRDARRS